MLLPVGVDPKVVAVDGGVEVGVLQLLSCTFLGFLCESTWEVAVSFTMHRQKSEIIQYCLAHCDFNAKFRNVWLARRQNMNSIEREKLSYY